jgi:glycerol uptake facilitator-like aquaporin
VLLIRKAAAEFIGTAFLLVAVIGSGIAAQRLSPHDVGLELLENAAATGVALVAIILALGPVSGAHLNPVVTVLDAAMGGVSPREVPAYAGAQLAGGVAGAIIANLMFALPAVTIATHERSGNGLLVAEVVATFGLLLVIFGTGRGGHPQSIPFAVGAYIAGAYFFTSSTSFANPAVTISRELSDTFAGIRPSSVPGFVAMQGIGAVLCLGVLRLLYPRPSP